MKTEERKKERKYGKYARVREKIETAKDYVHETKIQFEQFRRAVAEATLCL